LLPQDKVGPWTLLLAGGSLILTLVVNPDGIAGTGYAKRQRKLKAMAASRAPAPSVLSPSTTTAVEA
jgi:hypothetical protein